MERLPQDDTHSQLQPVCAIMIHLTACSCTVSLGSDDYRKAHTTYGNRHLTGPSTPDWTEHT